MHSNMGGGIKIPTLLGLGLLLFGLGTGVYLVTQRQFIGWKTKASASPAPQKAAVFNLTSTQASVFWLTDEPAAGFVQAGPSPLLGLTVRDERDSKSPLPHKLHFATLTNLLPGTTYYYKIVSGGTSYPPNNAFSFKTPAESAPTGFSPLIGLVVDSNSQPVEETLVSLEVPGAEPLAAITKTGGNFILPLPALYTSSLEPFKLESAKIDVVLTLADNQTTSRVDLSLPFPELTLPTLTLGKNLTLEPTEEPSPPLPEDLNRDGVVNSLDLAILRNNLGKNPKEKQADLNLDKVVDQKDVELMNRAITVQSAPR